MTAPTGILRLPVTPENSTVLGCRRSRESVVWRGLNWNDVRVDGGLFFLPELAAVLNPAYAHPDDPPSVWAGVRYRVRCRYEIGERLHIDGRYAYVRSVEAEQAGDGWVWVVGYGAKGVDE